ncbi:hypothetical protein JHK87_026950 [Glycine soja]|nr:hypothetical protein JHK87_026950 [Glycine soja]
MLSANLLFSDMYHGRRLSDSLTFLRTDLATVIVDATKANQPFPADELKRWMIQILSGLDTYHRHMSAWAGCSKLLDYGIISFSKVENPVGLEACLPNQSLDEMALVKKLVFVILLRGS